jgi:hypothetical protein
VVEVYMCTGRCLGRKSWHAAKIMDIDDSVLERIYSPFDTKHMEAKLCVLRMTGMGLGRSHTIERTLFWKAERATNIKNCVVCFGYTGSVVVM